MDHPDAHIVVYGGDGTINEVANGIISSGAGRTSLLSVVAAGTGNDFVRTFHEKNRIIPIDAIKYNDRYAVNIINFGFDSNVVAKTERYKKIFAGSPAYIAGVISTLFSKIGEKWKINIKNADGSEESFEDNYMLALIGNCRYYGGGFCSASLADPSDGELDLVAVKKISRIKFASLIGDYKKGTHLDASAMSPIKKFSDIMIFRRIKEAVIRGIKNICADGEIEETECVIIRVVPNALRIAT
jgi:diacylglycerol kinase family enzyme